MLTHLHFRKRLLFTSILGLLIIAGYSGWLIWRTHHGSHQYDVIVVGAGPGGIGASIQAARMGEHVALFEPTDWIGGQMTAAGVGSMDEGSGMAEKSGLYAEFVKNVKNFYSTRNKSTGTCYYSAVSICVDPQVGRTILGQMLQDAGPNLHIYTDTSVTGITKSGETVTGVQVGDTHYSSKVVIDADEYGDVLAMAGAAYRLGNSTSDAIDPTACIQDITYTAVMKYYPKGVPAALRLTSPPPGYSTTVANHFATYLKANGYGLQQKGASLVASNRLPMSFQSYTAYRGYPDLTNQSNYNALQLDGHTITRTSLNLGNDFPLAGVLSDRFISDPSYRANASCQAKELTLQLIYYIQHDMGETGWSIANDEGYSTTYNQAHHCAALSEYEAFENNMSQEPYVREGRRLIGEETLTGNDLTNSWNDKKSLTAYPDSIAVGFYSMDLHQCNTEDTLETALDKANEVQRGGPFEVPMGTLIPQQVNGLIAAEKNISTSRLANGSVREQPIAMDIGQAAGALAALAVKNHTQPRAISASAVQTVLHEAHGITSLSSLGYHTAY